MKKTKYLIGLILFIALMMIATTVNATTEVTRTVIGNGTDMQFDFTGLELDTAHEYEFGLAPTRATAIETWHLITDYTETSAKVDIQFQTNDLKKVINQTDTGYITIKDKTANTVVLEPTAVDLKVPYLMVSNYTVLANGTELSATGEHINIAIRSAKNDAFYKYEKIEDENIINKYKEIKSKNGDYMELQSLIPTSVTNSNWSEWGFWNGLVTSEMNGYGYTQRVIEAPDTGLYYMWLYFSGDNIKPVYGCILVDNFVKDTQKPTVESISVISPAEGTYKTGQTVQIAVNFSEPISATQVPTLKVRFGESPERELTNGTISKTSLNKGQVVYSYDIQNDDKGQLITVSLLGGTVKDEAGNEAILSCPVITGNMIKANVDGTTITETDNQDKKEDKSGQEEEKKDEQKQEAENKEQTKKEEVTIEPIEEKKSDSQKADESKVVTVSAGNEKKDTTTASKKLPYTGSGIQICIVLIVIVGIASVTYFKYNKLKGI